MMNNADAPKAAMTGLSSEEAGRMIIG